MWMKFGSSIEHPLLFYLGIMCMRMAGVCMVFIICLDQIYAHNKLPHSDLQHIKINKSIYL